MYLKVYNNLNALLWSFNLIISLRNVLYPVFFLKKYIIYIQSFMILDVLNVILKLVPGQILTTSLQIFSRIFVVWFILPDQQNINIFNYLMYIAWSIAEIVRYSFYEHKNVSWLKLIRYNMFFVLYPMGVLTGELPLIFQHFMTNHKIVDLIIMIIYIPFFPYLYFHMIKQKNKQAKKDKEMKKKE